MKDAILCNIVDSDIHAKVETYLFMMLFSFLLILH